MADLTDEQKKYNDELLNRLKKCCDELYPHFDSIKIFATKHENNELGTTHFDYGVGNVFAIYGQVSCWMHEQISAGKDEE